MIDGLWTGEFNANINNITLGIGVLIFRQGRIYGGNATNYLVGHYELDGSRIRGQMRGTHYAGDPITPLGVIPPSGTHELTFSGEWTPDEIILDATPANQTVVRVKGVLLRRKGPEGFFDAATGPLFSDGLWVGEYNANTNNIYLGHNVVLLYRGALLGGNATTYLTGDFNEVGDRIVGTATLHHYAGAPLTIVGLIEEESRHEISFTGELGEEGLTLEMEPEDHTVVRVVGSLSRVQGPELF